MVVGEIDRVSWTLLTPRNYIVKRLWIKIQPLDPTFRKKMSRLRDTANMFTSKTDIFEDLLCLFDALQFLSQRNWESQSVYATVHKNSINELLILSWDRIFY